MESTAVPDRFRVFCHTDKWFIEDQQNQLVCGSFSTYEIVKERCKGLNEGLTYATNVWVNNPYSKKA